MPEYEFGRRQRRINVLDTVDERSHKLARSRTALIRIGTVVASNVGNDVQIKVGNATFDAITFVNLAIGEVVAVTTDTDAWWVIGRYGTIAAGGIGVQGPPGPPGPPGPTGGTGSLGRVVTEYGVPNNGVDPAGAAINAVIAGSNPGDAIIFPGGTYLIETTVLLKANRSYVGFGSAIFKQKSSTELDSMVAVDPAEPFPRRNILWQSITLDGNRDFNTSYTAGSGYAKNRGMVLSGVQFSNFIDLHITDCGNDGLVFTGTSSSFNNTTSTNHFLSPYIYDCARFGVAFGSYSDDNHIFDADIGYCDFGSALFLAGSSSIRDSTLWGTKYSHGVVIGASSNQLIGCQIEGHYQHGIFVTEFGSYIHIEGCKIYYNSLQTSGAYDGIYVNGTAANPCRYITIQGNFIYAGIGAYGGLHAHRHSITLDTYHESCHIDGNNIELQAVGAVPDNVGLQVYGLAAKDFFNGRRWTTSTARPTNVVPGEVAYEKDTGLLWHYSEYRARKERILTSGHATDGGSFTVATAGLTFADVTFADRFDTAYTPFASASWNTTIWFTNLTSTGFRINVGTPTPASGRLDWGLIRQGI